MIAGIELIGIKSAYIFRLDVEDRQRFHLHISIITYTIRPDRPATAL